MSIQTEVDLGQTPFPDPGVAPPADATLVGAVPYAEFLTSCVGQDRARFLERVRDPHLLLRAKMGSGDRVQIGTVVRASSLETLRKGVEQLVVAPLRKRDCANPFTEMITLGRAENNDLVVYHPMISKFHAYFRRSGEWWSVSDANSSNGTWVDGHPVSAHGNAPLRSGSQIQLAGTVVLEFVLPEDLFERTIRLEP